MPICTEHKEFVVKFDRLTQALLTGDNADRLSPTGPAPAASRPGGSDGRDGNEEVMDEAPSAPPGFEEQLQVLGQKIRFLGFACSAGFATL